MDGVVRGRKLERFRRLHPFVGRQKTASGEGSRQWGQHLVRFLLDEVLVKCSRPSTKNDLAYGHTCRSSSSVPRGAPTWKSGQARGFRCDAPKQSAHDRAVIPVRLKRICTLWRLYRRSALHPPGCSRWNKNTVFSVQHLLHFQNRNYYY